MIFIELVIDASPDAHDELADLARRTAAATRDESGCVLYRFAVDVEQPGRFVLTELWEDEASLKAHFGREAFQGFFAGLPSGISFVSSRAWEGPLASYSPPNPGVRPPD